MVCNKVHENVEWSSKQVINSHKATGSPEWLTATCIHMLFSEPSNFCCSFTAYDIRFHGITCETVWSAELFISLLVPSRIFVLITRQNSALGLSTTQGGCIYRLFGGLILDAFSGLFSYAPGFYPMLFFWLDAFCRTWLHTSTEWLWHVSPWYVLRPLWRARADYLRVQMYPVLSWHFGSIMVILSSR